MSDTLHGLPKPPRAKLREAVPAKAALLAGGAVDAEAAAMTAESYADTPASVAAPAPVQPIEEPIMETVNTTQTTAAADTTLDMGADLQARAKAAFDKGAAMTADMTTFQKDNLEALVEAGKVLAAGMQELGRGVMDDARTAAQTATADVKAMAAIKSPTELFQLQGEIMRRNLDAMVAKGSHTTEAMTKLANEMFAPLTSRASMAMDRMSKAA